MKSSGILGQLNEKKKKKKDDKNCTITLQIINKPLTGVE